MFQNWCFWVVYTCSKTLFTIISASSNHESKSSLKPPLRCVLYHIDKLITPWVGIISEEKCPLSLIQSIHKIKDTSNRHRHSSLILENTFHLANICIIKIRIFSIKTSVLFLITNCIALNWFQSAQATKKANNIYTFYNARSLLMYSKYITYLLHSLTRELDIKELCFVFFPNRKKSLTCLKKVDYSESNCKGAYLNSKYWTQW